MEFKSRITQKKQLTEIVEDLAFDNFATADLGILFIAKHPPTQIQKITEELKKRIGFKHFLGCTGAGIIGSYDEVENSVAASLITAQLPEVQITPFAMDQSELDKMEDKKDLYKYLQIFPNDNPIFIVLPDPFMFNMNVFLDLIQEAYPKAPIIGGLASEATQPNKNTLILDQESCTEGLIGIVLSGNIRVDTVVSQGCRPIGETHIITKAENNIIYELAGKNFIEILQETLEKAPERDRTLAQESIFLGIAINEYIHEYKRGDFLIRGLMGIDQKTGAGVIGDYIKPGQTIQFHVRDARTATEDLQELLTRQQKNENSQKPKGALVFSCNGRGEYLFQQKNHDINIIQRHIGPVPAAGFFCAGEIGPIGGNNFLHGFTDSIGLFYPKN